MLNMVTISKLDWEEWAASRPGCIVPGERTLVHVGRGRWVILHLGLNAVGDKISLPLPDIKLGFLTCTITNILTKSSPVRYREL